MVCNTYSCVNFYSTTVVPLLRAHPQIHATVVSTKRWSFTRGGLSIMLIREVHAVPGLLLEVVSHQRGLSKEGLL